MSSDTPFTSDPETFVLGETTGEHRLDHLDQTADATLALTQQARRILRIYTNDLDQPLYGTDAFVEAAGSFARRNEHTSIRILVRDPTGAVRRHHPLIDLLRALSSHIEARRISSETGRETFAFLLADDHGYLYRPYHDRFEGIVNFSAGPVAVERRKWFDRLWEESQPEPEFRRLSI